MSNRLKSVLREVDRLPEGERILLLAHLISARQKLWRWPSERKLTWQEAMGRGAPAVVGEDAQQWVSETRAEDDRHRAERGER